MNKFSRRQQFFVGLTLFSMFFGAGNLIFPPFLGAQAGSALVPAIFGMAVSAVGLPVLGVVAVAQAGGLHPLAARVHPKFADLFTLLAYLSIGPCLAIPRTATTSFEMAVLPFAGQSPVWMRALYSLVFFAVAFAVALNPDRLTDRLGKVTGPALLALIAVIVIACLLRHPGGTAAPAGNFAAHPAIPGFLEGYQTMDTIAALNFGIVIALNIRARGIHDDRAVIRATMRAGWIAGGVLLLVYAALAGVGMLSGSSFPGADNGAQVLTRLVSWLFGPMGNLLLGIVFVIACFNTCTGLISCCGEYFTAQFPILGYKAWALVFSVVSFGISIFGLNTILAVSVPILNAIYPVAIVLIFLGLAHRWLGGFNRIYRVTVLFTGVASVGGALADAGLYVPLVTAIPLYDIGLGWLLPSASGLLLGVILSDRSSA
ncbi:MAG: branched-chain amino acid transport system II carrier protein [Butyricicoccus pullicaecorum]|nr:branched-chain amino acid transport system II carrier protein [Butyricicoccus pullicaecorum]